MTPCTHGHAADPRMCDTCRPALAAETHHVDPEIEAQWIRAARELDRRLGPYVQDHVRWPLALQFIRDLATEGFRPPLRPPRPAITAQAVDPDRQRDVNDRGVQVLRENLPRRDTG